MRLETLGIDVPDAPVRRRRLNPNDPRVAQDADFQSAWNPIVIARHVIQHRRTPLYNKYEFPQVNKVLLPGEFDWLNREEPVLNPLPAGRRLPNLNSSSAVAKAQEKIATGKSPMKKIGMAIGELTSSGLLGEDTLSGLDGIMHRFGRVQQSHVKQNHTRQRMSGLRRPRLLGSEPEILGGWLKRMKRKASNLSHQALNVATKIPVVGTYASMARAAGNLAHGELPSLNTIMGSVVPGGSAGTSLLSNAVNAAKGAIGNLPGNLSDIASSASNLVQGIQAGSGTVPGVTAAQNFLDRANTVPANAGAYYSTPSASTLQAIDKTAGQLAVPENLPASAVVREVPLSKAESESWAKKHEKALIGGSIALAGLAALGGFAYYKKHKKQVEVPAIGEF
jgi:hypothetical protein